MLSFFLVFWFVIYLTNDFNFILVCYLLVCCLLFCVYLWRKQHKESVYDYNEGVSEVILSCFHSSVGRAFGCYVIQGYSLCVYGDTERSTVRTRLRAMVVVVCWYLLRKYQQMFMWCD